MPILQISILSRSGNLAFHSFFQRAWGSTSPFDWVKETLWTYLTEKIAFESGSQISLACLGATG